MTSLMRARVPLLVLCVGLLLVGGIAAYATARTDELTAARALVRDEDGSRRPAAQARR
ncbi:MAG TPA: hypothetical protein VM345_14395 [Acidimicrobiales bacterium]|jgi:hypothetical protein|nr:hypothetical protein [Acidimicrobiales bacterium]